MLPKPPLHLRVLKIRTVEGFNMTQKLPKNIFDLLTGEVEVEKTN